MPSTIQWKLKPMIACVLLTLFLIINIIVFVHELLWSSKGSVEKKLLANTLVKWVEPTGKYNLNDPGENGVAFKHTDSEQMHVDIAYSAYGFNQFISDKISIHRSIPDPRPKECISKLYQSRLPKVSVVIIFHNEGWSTLLRTVHSVLDRSPPELLKEIVLCDDFSAKEHLKKKLEDYILAYPKVKLVRTKEREGLIRARVFGADHASGDVLLFLDSHCEANLGWLPPLLSEVEKDYRTVVCPTVDFIDHADFHYRGVDPYIRGTFNWRFDYKEKGINAAQKALRKDGTDGVLSPVMAGGLFAISRKFWLELGKYDPGMYVWGGEQYEISFKLWMCGGKMLNMPCSRVGHVYRRNVPYTYDKPNAVLVNFKRVAEVWMGDFKEFLFQKRPEIRYQKHGNIVERLAIRDRNKCKSFKWYLQNVANDTIRTKYEPDRAYGPISNVGSGFCLDSLHRSSGQPIALSRCQGSSTQMFHWSNIYELRQDPEECLDARFADVKNVYTEKCHEMGGNQKFTYNPNTKQIVHSGTGFCVSVPDSSIAQHSMIESNPLHPVIETCDSNLDRQRWSVQMKDLSKPPPQWARIAEDLALPPIP